jgi:NADPH:quinone reductase-like Zn-dependent oxidoreductase
MKALAYNTFGSLDVLHIAELPVPQPRRGQLLVAVRATSLNLIDARVRKGTMGVLVNKRFPKIPGADVAGIVAAVGADVGTFKVGDAVFGAVNPFVGGSLSEYVAVPAARLALKPAGLSFEEAASLPIAGLAALQALRDLGQAGTGSRVLIHGASGPVGLFAVQIAKHLGAHVTAVVAGAHGVAAVARAGADKVLDSRMPDGQAFGHPFDIILNASGAMPFAEAKRWLVPNGRHIEPSPTVPLFIGSKLANLVRSKKHLALAVSPNRADLELLAQLAEQRRVVPVIAQRFAFPDAKRAFGALDQGGNVGKLVVSIA